MPDPFIALASCSESKHSTFQWKEAVLYSAQGLVGGPGLPFALRSHRSDHCLSIPDQYSGLISDSRLESPVLDLRAKESFSSFPALWAAAEACRAQADSALRNILPPWFFQFFYPEVMQGLTKPCWSSPRCNSSTCGLASALKRDCTCFSLSDAGLIN